MLCAVGIVLSEVYTIDVIRQLKQPGFLLRTQTQPIQTDDEHNRRPYPRVPVTSQTGMEPPALAASTWIPM
jgi:hypothetical protein